MFTSQREDISSICFINPPTWGPQMVAGVVKLTFQLGIYGMFNEKNGFCGHST